MKRATVAFLLLHIFLLLNGCNGTTGGVPDNLDNNAPLPNLTLQSFVSGLTAPVGFEAPADSTGRIFIVEQAGVIRVVQNGVLLPAPFLDITTRVISGGELGLLGLAFHPNFRLNGLFYVNYTRQTLSGLETVIAEYQATPPGSNQAAFSSERILLIVEQPFANHNGGQLAFGPHDGNLYIALGDGGSSGDPQNNAQDTNEVLGKILRIGVDPPFAADKAYAIPSDNPFVSGGGAPEVWAYGLRNPWRFSFDLPTQRLFAGDVGQNSFEEVDLITRQGNFGWNIMEGNHCFPPGVSSCNMTGLILPIVEYPNPSEGTSVIGGFVYRGSTIPALVGTYVFGDLTGGKIWGLRQNSAGTWVRTTLATHNRTVSAFGRDTNGELYLVDFNGAVLRIVAVP
jgi:glucose/arabinose dehydrogenase